MDAIMTFLGSAGIFLAGIVVLLWSTSASAFKISLRYIDAISLLALASLTEAGLVDRECVTLPARAAYAEHIFNQYTLRVPRRDEFKAHLAA